jgi:subtilisin family serine protease
MKHVSRLHVGLVCACLAALAVSAAHAQTTDVSSTQTVEVAPPQTPDDVSDYYWYYDGQKVSFGVSTTKMAVIFEGSATQSDKLNVPLYESAVARLAECRDEKKRVQMVELQPGLAKADVEAAVARTALLPGVRFATPILTLAGKDVFVPNGDILAQFAENTTDDAITSLSASLGTSVSRKLPIPKDEQDPQLYVLRVTDPTRNKPSDVANLYHADPRVLWAEPDGYILTLGPCVTPNDPEFTPYHTRAYWDTALEQWVYVTHYQWNLMQVANDPNYGDHDIDADEAWDIQSGSANIIMAVLDEGCDLNHPDLNFWTNTAEANGLPGVDDDTNGYVDDIHGFNFYDYSGGVHVSPSNHGTPCAGVSSAITGNNEGIAGICGGAQILVLAINTWQGENVLFTTNSRIVEAINYARTYAHVLSNSWGSNTWPAFPSTAIEAALRNARNLGRGGKGCPVIFAANNYNLPVTWPASLKWVTAVGATDESDMRWNYSNWGLALDIVAPSHVIAPFSSANHNFTPDLYDILIGTSGACPHVAGVAGLLIALDPTLTANQIQAIIQFSSDDKGTTGRDHYYGYGRLNARKALEMAQEERLVFTNASGVPKMSFFVESGHMVVEGILRTYANQKWLQKDPSDLLVIYNPHDEEEMLARLDKSGNFILKDGFSEMVGEAILTEYYLACSFPGKESYPPDDGPYAAYIGICGDLFVVSRLFVGGDADRASSQGY